MIDWLIDNKKLTLYYYCIIKWFFFLFFLWQEWNYGIVSFGGGVNCVGEVFIIAICLRTEGTTTISHKTRQTSKQINKHKYGYKKCNVRIKRAAMKRKKHVQPIKPNTYSLYYFYYSYFLAHQDKAAGVKIIRLSKYNDHDRASLGVECSRPLLLCEIRYLCGLPVWHSRGMMPRSN